jgi:hypothetical protein
MSDLIHGAVFFLVSNYLLTLFVLGILVAILAVLRTSGPKSLSLVVDKLLEWHVFFVVGVGYLVNFIFHCFFGPMSAAFIGWADSPFQFEVGTASLGFALVGFIATFRSYDLRLAAIVGPSIFLLGAAAGHIYQMVTEHNFAPGNAGVIFYMDILIPIFGYALLWLARPSQTAATTASKRSLAAA